MTDTTEKKFGIVFYTDGGARPNPGFGGTGLHGYKYTYTPTAKGCGLGQVIPTTNGYQLKTSPDIITGAGCDVAALIETDVVVATEIEKYYDGVMSMFGVVSNNLCEILGVYNALKIAEKEQVAFLHLFCDSEYALEGTRVGVDKWESRDWKKTDGGVISNVELWKSIKALRDKLISEGVHIKYNWVKGHSGNTGNECSDTLATIAVFMSRSGLKENIIYESPGDTYWKRDSDRHPIMTFSRCYFNPSNLTNPENWYFGNTSGKDHQDGARASDIGLIVAKLEKPVEFVETIINLQRERSGPQDSIYTLHLDNLFSSKVTFYAKMFGTKAFTNSSNDRMDLMYKDDVIITREHRPAGLVRRTITILEEMQLTLTNFEIGSKLDTITDITDTFYTTTRTVTKTKKDAGEKVTVSTKLNPEFIVGFTNIEVKAKIPNGETKSINLNIGLDTLERNSLKRLESTNPKMYLVSWAISDIAYRYAVIMVAGGDKVITASPYSNLRVI